MRKSTDLLISRMASAFEPHGALAEFCRKTGFPRKTVENWLQGTTIPTTALDSIAEGLDMSPWDLIKPDAPDLPPTALEIVRILPRLNDDQLRALLGTARLFAHLNDTGSDRGEQRGGLAEKQKRRG